MSDDKGAVELLVMRIMARLPLSLVKALAGALAWLLSWLPIAWVSAHRDVLLNQLICFPEREWRSQRYHARRVLVQTARTLASYSHVWLRPAAQTYARIRTVHGFDVAQQAMRSGRPVLFLSLHQSAWEVPILTLGSLGPTLVMYQSSGSLLDRMVKNSRERSGCILVPADRRGVRTVLTGLEEGKAFALLADHQPGGKANPCVPFFGHTVPVPAFVYKVIKRYRPWVFFISAEYAASDSAYDVFISPASEAIYDADESITLTQMMNGLESIIRRAPDQYNWSYNRFRRGANGKRDWYKKDKALALIARIKQGESAEQVFKHD